MTDTLLTMAETARLLGVTRQQVATWYRRRDNNGFPEAAESKLLNGYRYKERLWAKKTVQAWFKQYEPDKGGRPPLVKV